MALRGSDCFFHEFLFCLRLAVLKTALLAFAFSIANVYFLQRLWNDVFRDRFQMALMFNGVKGLVVPQRLKISGVVGKMPF